jgi:hypothetical protein
MPLFVKARLLRRSHHSRCCPSHFLDPSARKPYTIICDTCLVEKNLPDRTRRILLLHFNTAAIYKCSCCFLLLAIILAIILVLVIDRHFALLFGLCLLCRMGLEQESVLTFNGVSLQFAVVIFGVNRFVQKTAIIMHFFHPELLLLKDAMAACQLLVRRDDFVLSFEDVPGGWRVPAIRLYLG